MNKKINILWILLSSIFVIVFNAVIFLIMKEFTTAFWVSYGFIHFAYLMFVLSTITMPKVKSSLVFGYPLIYLSFLYFIGAFFIGLVFIYFKNASFNASFIPQLIIAGLYALAYMTSLIFTEKAIHKEQESKYYSNYIKDASAELRLLMEQTTDAMLKKNLEKLYDTCRSSQVKSHPTLYGLEEVIAQNIQLLKGFVTKNEKAESAELIDTISMQLLERNRKISNML
ncbi:hypothetical protein [Gorillibacterium sp. sgz5001074]|uniref:hypothetical protein n=1 Tax=Gorillibacterium sp. sgz5001074 TaxID=3446695 RepID=UPI003F6703AE